MTASRPECLHYSRSEAHEEHTPGLRVFTPKQWVSHIHMPRVLRAPVRGIVPLIFSHFVWGMELHS